MKMIVDKKYKYKKLKSQYRDNYKEYCFFWGSKEILEYDRLPNIRSHSHRHFSTKQEACFYNIHLYEYKEYGLKLRNKRSSSSLPNSWDDLPSYTYKNKKSWKTSTKRKKQYYK